MCVHICSRPASGRVGGPVGSGKTALLLALCRLLAGGCPHTAVRDDISQNLDALRQLMRRFTPQLLFVESGGDNLAAQFSRELADGADLGVMARDAGRMRGDGPFLFAQVLHGTGVREVADHVLAAWRAATDTKAVDGCGS